MTLHAAIELSPPQVADLLGQLAVVDSKEDADDVLRRLVDQAATRALAELRQQARSTAPSGGDTDLATMAARAATLQLALQELRSVELGPEYEERLAGSEERLLALLLGSPSMSPGSDG